METFTFFAKTKVIHSSVKLAEKIKKWFIDEKIIKPEPSEDNQLYYADTGYTKIVKDDWSGEVEFITQKQELRHVLGWDLGVDFLLPNKVICPECSTNLIKGIDPATFYGEGTKEQDPKEMRFLQELAEGISIWSSEKEVPLKCHTCAKENLIEDYDYDNSLIFTNFAIVFWNWPTLNEAFLKSLKERLGKDVFFEIM